MALKILRRILCGSSDASQPSESPHHHPPPSSIPSTVSPAPSVSHHSLTYSVLMSMIHTRLQDLTSRLSLSSNPDVSTQFHQLQTKLQSSLLAAQYITKFDPFLNRLYLRVMRLTHKILNAEWNTNTRSTIFSIEQADAVQRLLGDIRDLFERAKKLDFRALLEDADRDSCKVVIPTERFGVVPPSPMSTKSWKVNDDEEFKNHARPTTTYRQVLFYKAHWAYVLYLRFKDKFPSPPPAPSTPIPEKSQPVRIGLEALLAGPDPWQNPTKYRPMSEMVEEKSKLQKREDEKRRAWIDSTVPRAEAVITLIAMIAEQCCCRAKVLAYRTKKQTYMAVLPEIIRDACFIEEDDSEEDSDEYEE